VANQYGVIVSFGAQSNRIGTDGNRVSDALEQNLISGNIASGIWFEELNTKFNRIAGNAIGLNAAQNAKLGNSGFGTLFRHGTSTNWDGTNGDGVADAVEGNVIAGNANHGIILASTNGSFLTNNVVAGNFVGTTAAGTAGLGNLRGVVFSTGVRNS